MNIPDFNEYGLLPEGIYKANLKEIEEKFCSIGNISIRKNLFSQFKRYLEEVVKHNVEYDIYVDGSFVRDKEKPGDIDILLFYDNEYNNREWLGLINKDIVDIKFKGIDLLTGSLGLESEELTIDFAMSHFDEDTYTEMKKGIIKVII